MKKYIISGAVLIAFFLIAANDGRATLGVVRGLERAAFEAHQEQGRGMAQAWEEIWK